MESILPPEILAESKPMTKAAYMEMTEYVVLFQCGGKYRRQRILIYIRLSFTYKYAHTLHHFNRLTLQVPSAENIDIMPVIPGLKVLPSNKLLKVTFV
jgi:hypothetical protein